MLWRGVLARASGGGAVALTNLATGLGALLPLVISQPWAVIASAALFGGSFFMVPTAITTFGRKNLAQPLWGASISLFTVIFSIGQIVGPVGAGALADAAGSTEKGLVAGGCILIAGAVFGLLQRPLKSI